MGWLAVVVAGVRNGDLDVRILSARIQWLDLECVLEHLVVVQNSIILLICSAIMRNRTDVMILQRTFFVGIGPSPDRLRQTHRFELHAGLAWRVLLILIILPLLLVIGFDGIEVLFVRVNHLLPLLLGQLVLSGLVHLVAAISSIEALVLRLAVTMRVVEVNCEWVFSFARVGS